MKNYVTATDMYMTMAMETKSIDWLHINTKHTPSSHHSQTRLEV